MDDNTTIVLVVLIIGVVFILCLVGLYVYTPFMGGYHHLGYGMMHY